MNTDIPIIGQEQNSGLEINITPGEYLDWKTNGRVIRGNFVYTRSGTIYNIQANGNWVRIKNETDASTAILKFWKLDEQIEQSNKPKIFIP